MRNIKKQLLTSALAMGLTSFVLIANAQEHQRDNCKSAANPEECRHADHLKMMEKRAEKLHADLKLSADQESAWNNLKTSMKQQAEAMHSQQRPSREEMDKLSAPERMEKHLAMQQQHLAAMQANLSEVKKFYAVLTPEQQAIFNKEAKRFPDGYMKGKKGERDGKPGDHPQPPAQ